MNSTEDAPRRRRWPLVLAIGAAVAVVAAIGLWRFLSPPQTPPEYTDARPEPSDDGYVSATHSVLIDAPREAVHEWNNEPDRELGDLIEGGEAIEVVGTTTVWGSWDPVDDRTGARRRVEFADGHFLAEEVLIDTPDRFRYMIWGFTSYQRLAVSYGVAEFTFAEEGDDQTRVTWMYSLKPTVGLVRPFVSSFVDSTISSMMTDTLEAMRNGVEADHRTP